MQHAQVRRQAALLELHPQQITLLLSPSYSKLVAISAVTLCWEPGDLAQLRTTVQTYEYTMLFQGFTITNT